MIPVSQFGRACSAFSERDTCYKFKNCSLKYLKLLHSKAGSHYDMPSDAILQISRFSSTNKTSVKASPAWAATSPRVRTSQWSTVTDFPIFIPLQVRNNLLKCVLYTAQIKTCILSLTRKPLSEFPWKKRTTPSGLYKSCQSLTASWYSAIAKEQQRWDWSDSAVIPVISDISYKYALLSEKLFCS